MNQRAIVVFLGEDLVERVPWYFRWLKRGFVHCFVLVELMESKGNWIKIEGKHGVMSVKFAGFFESLDKTMSYYRDQGAVVVSLDVKRDPLRLPFVERTCVGLIKAVLGIQLPLITPWQLYKHLRRNSEAI